MTFPVQPDSTAVLMGAEAWHLAGQAQADGQRIQLRNGEHPVEMLLMQLDMGDLDPGEVKQQFNAAEATVVYLSPPAGELHLATFFLSKEWVGAQVSWAPEGNEILLATAEGGRHLSLPPGGFGGG